ncbi:ricin-type beta-trefoil lectin domain protein, partial [Streptomyces sp. NPDC006658]|uniref:ricin-type beta-trefoil lectin domain protein n=1 Tax=Streptomyces sp. NPDC006658 TaxID=3156900 RepID=UPI0033C78EA0
NNVTEQNTEARGFRKTREGLVVSDKMDKTVVGPPRAGTSAVLAVCSAAATQRWTYGGDGVLRSAAGAGLCLDSHADAGVVLLGDCPGAGAARGADVRYDLTAQGELTPRWDRSLALAADAGRPGADVVVKVRDGSAGERWT